MALKKATKKLPARAKPAEKNEFYMSEYSAAPRVESVSTPDCEKTLHDLTDHRGLFEFRDTERSAVLWAEKEIRRLRDQVETAKQQRDSLAQTVNELAAKVSRIAGVLEG